MAKRRDDVEAAAARFVDGLSVVRCCEHPHKTSPVPAVSEVADLIRTERRRAVRLVRRYMTHTFSRKVHRIKLDVLAKAIIAKEPSNG